MSKTLSWTVVTPHRPLTSLLRRVAAVTLRAASASMARAARQLRRPPERAPRLPDIEFHPMHGEAGAPEGALYVDGELVAVLPVRRL